MPITEGERTAALVAVANAVSAGIGTASAETHLNSALTVVETEAVATLLCVQFGVTGEGAKLTEARERLALIDPETLDVDLEHAQRCRAAPVLWDAVTGPLYKAERELALQLLHGPPRA